MDRPPLPDPVARRARSYLAALVPAGRTSDAWHELVADVTYWGDREELPVLRLAHQVVLQHERVTEEVATLALDELGISSSHSVATVLDVSPADADVLLDRVAALVAEDRRPPDVHVFDADVGAVGTPAASGEEHGPAPGAGDDPTAEPAEPATPDAVPEDPEASQPDAREPDTPEPDSSAPEPTEPDATTPSADDRHGARAVRIGFEEDDVIQVGGWGDDPAGLDGRRWLAIVAVVVVAAVLLWLLTA